VIFGVISSHIEANSVWAKSSSVFPFILETDSSYQNTAEFIAVVAGVALLVRRGFCNKSLHMKGDNVSSLRWGKDERFKPVRSL